MASPRTNTNENPDAGSQPGKSDTSASLRAMRALNINPKRPDANELKKLDSSIKKTTALRRKLVKISAENEDVLIKEMQSLNLTRYINEVVTALLSSSFRLVDVPSALKICSLLHQSYAEFATEFIPALKKVLVPSNKADDLNRKRAILRLLIELFVSGIVVDMNCSLLAYLVDQFNDDLDKDPQANIILILTFLRYGRADLLGIRSDPPPRIIKEDDKGSESKSNPPDASSGSEPAATSGDQSQSSATNTNSISGDAVSLTSSATIALTAPSSLPLPEPIVSKEAQTRMTNAVTAAYNKISAYMIHLHTELRSLEKQNHEIENTKGEVSSEAMNEYQKQRTLYEKTIANVTSLSELIQLPFPKLPIEKKVTRVEAPKENVSPSVKPGSALWEDEGMRLFYEELHNLSLIVHPALLGNSIKESEERLKAEKEEKGSENEKEEAKDDGEKETDETAEAVTATEPEKKRPEEAKPVATAVQTEEPDEALEPSQQEAFNSFVLKLENMMSPSMVDQMAVDFCYLSKRGNKKRLVNALFAVNRNKLDIIPYYARLVATLHPYMKDIGPQLVAKLEVEFRQLYEEKNQLKIESKMKNIKFLAELVKFKICPHNVIFNCLKMCLDDFLHHNVDVACMLLETCGRYLFKREDTAVKTKTMIERMMRLKKTKNLDSKQETMIENAYYSCCPPTRLAIQKKEKAPMVQYLEKLIYSDLSEKNARVVMRKLRKLDWEKYEFKVVQIFLKVHKAKYDRISTIASIISGLAQHYEGFGVLFVDLLLEEINTALHERNYIYNQRLILHTKLLGDLYNYSLIEHAVIFDRLYGFLGCGVGELPQPLAVADKEKEASDGSEDRRRDQEKIINEEQYDLFRIRLVCTLLDTCGHYFKKGTHKERLDFYLAHFQVYINAKVFWSRDIQFHIDDIFEELRPKAPRYYTYEAALGALKELEAKKNPKGHWGYKSYRITTVQETEVEEEDDSKLASDSAAGGDASNVTTDKDDLPVGERGGGLDEDDEGDDENDEDNEGEEVEEPVDLTLLKPKSAQFIPCKEDDAFLKQLESMMASPGDEGTGRVTDPRILNMNIAIPMQRAGGPSIPAANDDNTINFKMIVKKGNKQKVLNLPIPSDNKIASHHLKERELAKEQKNELKKLVLQLDQRDRQHDEDRTHKLETEGISFGSQSYLKSNDRTQTGANFYNAQRGYNFDGDDDGRNPYVNLSTSKVTARGRGYPYATSGRGQPQSGAGSQNTTNSSLASNSSVSTSGVSGNAGGVLGSSGSLGVNSSGNLSGLGGGSGRGRK